MAQASPSPWDVWYFQQDKTDDQDIIRMHLPPAQEQRREFITLADHQYEIVDRDGALLLISTTDRNHG